MQKYLRLSEAKAILGHGEKIGQFLGAFSVDGQAALRYALIHRHDHKMVATVCEVFEPRNPLGAKLLDFERVNPNLPPDEFYFDSVEEAFSFLEYRNDAAFGRFVHEKELSAEYHEFRSGKP